MRLLQRILQAAEDPSDRRTEALGASHPILARRYGETRRDWGGGGDLQSFLM